MSLIGRFLRGVIKRGTLSLTHPDGTVEHFGAQATGWPDVGIHFLDKRVARQIVLDPELGAAEAFMDGRLVVEQGDIMQLVELLRGNVPWEHGGVLKPAGPAKIALDRAKTLFDGINGLRASRANVSHHYDIGNDLYRLFLDQDMQYSCAYWSSADMTLEAAQFAKKAHIAAKLALAPGQRVLDIGCGWGGMALYLHQKTGVEVLGITLSAEQLKIAQERAAAAGVSDKVRFELVDYRDLATREPGSFDRIVSVGMFEHVGVRNFSTFFRCCTNLMRDDGVMLLHTIGRMDGPGATDAFTRKYTFPGGYIPALSETLAASEKWRLIATDIENLRLHYALTLREWYKRTVANKDAIIALQDDRFYRMWTFYLAGATSAFESANMCNYQLQFSRNRRTLPLTRDYMGAAETKLLHEG
ncbi:MAG: cyclopropane-fatty-acyl-phospholipid synthase family protein [Parasphingorhabdus sp.]|nr:cyclopropane-fatty-acyl-phospholipid synthase family protein [Parasphingorhabdus sp.]